MPTSMALRTGRTWKFSWFFGVIFKLTGACTSAEMFEGTKATGELVGIGGGVN